ncbi:hypothetical protein [Spongiimicrobium sp. 3-5]|uniref:hypothetical protein n=1 Tax=Spongiimicrobium sp. 3-5 TaxID=3332596 RepID=UPI00397F9A35
MKFIHYLIVSLIVVSCNPIDKTKDLDKEAIIEEVGVVLNKYHKDVAKDGLSAEFKYLDKSVDFFWVPPGYSSALSYDSVRTILEKNAKAFQSVKLHWDHLQVNPLSNEIVNYSGIVGGVMIDTAGTSLNVSILESGTIIKRKNGWKLLSGQSRVLNTDAEN